MHGPKFKIIGLKNIILETFEFVFVKLQGLKYK
jgi:hypothetical protein